VPPDVQVDISVDEGLPLIDGHHDALARALSNVILNAVEACGHGGSIRVELKSASLRGGDAVELAVHDTGRGISAEHLKSIWEPYVTHKAGGTGLGLAIVRQTIQAHRGEVSAESAPGRGTVIRFIFPVPAHPAPTPAKPDHA
jgi:signal transduction histidine kinase